MNDLLRIVTEIRRHAETIVTAMQSAERPGAEDCGIAFVSGEAIVDACARLELESLGHHLMCSKRPDDQPAAHIEGQQGLL